tara:strand:+ start:158 stop:673 length:516 start_codon:yes stop_codon:yes gene_type:complete
LYPSFFSPKTNIYSTQIVWLARFICALGAQYYGSDRKDNTNFSSFDIIVSSYGTIASDYKNPGASKLLTTKFERLVMDEAHQLANPSTAQSKACREVRARSRWALTGTPCANALDDIFGLARVIKYEPWNSKAVWKDFVHNKSGQDVNMGKSMKRVGRILKEVMIRRTMMR